MAPTSPIRVLLVEDQPVMGGGLTASIGMQGDMEVAGAASNGEEAIGLYRQLRPDIVLLDLDASGTGGTDALLSIRGEFLEARVIVLTAHQDDGSLRRALEAGARGCVLKESPPADLMEAIRAVHGGQSYIPAGAARRLFDQLPKRPLTPREQEVLKLVALGLRNKEVGNQLGIAEETVKVHVRSLLGKFQSVDRTQLVTTALRRGILRLDDM